MGVREIDKDAELIAAMRQRLSTLDLTRPRDLIKYWKGLAEIWSEVAHRDHVKGDELHAQWARGQAKAYMSASDELELCMKYLIAD